MKKTLSIIPLAFLALILAGCWHVNVDMSKMPKNAKYCSSKWDCPVGYYCGFPGLDTYACCLPYKR